MNVCMFSGRVVRKPVCRMERRKKDNEKFAVVKFNLAVDDVHGNDSTVYPEFEIIGRQAEVFAEKVPKGTKICITRSALKTESYTKDGERVTRNIFRVYEWEFAESKKYNDSLRRNEYMDDESTGYGDDGLFDDDGYDDGENNVESQLNQARMKMMEGFQMNRNAERIPLPQLPKPSPKKIWNGFKPEEIKAYMEMGYSKEQLKEYERQMMSSVEGQKYMAKLMSSSGFVPANGEVPFQS